MTNDFLIAPHETEKIAFVDSIESQHPTKAQIDEHEASTHEVRFALSAASQPLDKSCNTTFHAVRNSGLRPISEIKWIVMHDTEGGTAKSVASYFSTTKSTGSAHVVVDDNDCYRTLKNEEVPWGAPGANYRGFHIEQCGYAKWTTAIWNKTHRRTLQRAAFKAAYHCKKFGIPVTFVDHAGLLKGQSGITTHAECTKAFGGTHTDPGTGWPRLIFMGLVRAYSLTLHKGGK